MRRSEERILTTHTGSLPRPAELTRLYLRRARGELVDPAELERRRTGGAARHRAPADDVGRRHRQQRRAAARGFFLHVQHRISGFGGSLAASHPGRRRCAIRCFGGSWKNSSRSAKRSATWGRPRRSMNFGTWAAARSMPNAPNSAPPSLPPTPTLPRPFVTAPSPGIIAAAMKNEYYETDEAYLAAIGAALREEYVAIVERGSCCRSTARTWRSNAISPTRTGRSASSWISSGGSSPRSTRHSKISRAEGSAPCLLGQLRGAARLRRAAGRDLCRSCSKPGSAPCSCRSPTRGTRTNIASSRQPPLAADQILVAGVSTA